MRPTPIQLRRLAQQMLAKHPTGQIWKGELPADETGDRIPLLGLVTPGLLNPDNPVHFPWRVTVFSMRNPKEPVPFTHLDMDDPSETFQMLNHIVPHGNWQRTAAAVSWPATFTFTWKDLGLLGQPLKRRGELPVGYSIGYRAQGVPAKTTHIRLFDDNLGETLYEIALPGGDPRDLIVLAWTRQIQQDFPEMCDDSFVFRYSGNQWAATHDKFPTIIANKPSEVYRQIRDLRAPPPLVNEFEQNLLHQPPPKPKKPRPLTTLSQQHLAQQHLAQQHLAQQHLAQQHLAQQQWLPMETPNGNIKSAPSSPPAKTPGRIPLRYRQAPGTHYHQHRPIEFAVHPAACCPQAHYDGPSDSFVCHVHGVQKVKRNFNLQQQIRKTAQEFVVGQTYDGGVVQRHILRLHPGFADSWRLAEKYVLLEMSPDAIPESEWLIDEDLVRRYADTTGPFQPIVVDESLGIIDGGHRLEAASFRGDHTIQVFVPTTSVRGTKVVPTTPPLREPEEET